MDKNTIRNIGLLKPKLTQYVYINKVIYSDINEIV